MAGVPFFGPGKNNAEALQKLNQRCLDDEKNYPAVASIRAHGTAKNLQGWNKVLFAECPQSATTWEQTLGRMHRKYQKAPNVNAWVALQTQSREESFAAALRQAEFIQDTIQTVGTQKMIFAQKTFKLENVLKFDVALLDRLWAGGDM
jgi:hypothetical protein